MQLSFNVWIRGQLICSSLILLLALLAPAPFSWPVCTAAIVLSWFGGLPLLFLFALSLYIWSFFTTDKPTVIALSAVTVVLACFTGLSCFSVCTGHTWQFWHSLPELCVFGTIAAIAGISSVLSYHHAIHRHVRHFSC